MKRHDSVGSSVPHAGFSRRQLLRTGVGAAGALALAACGTGGSSTGAAAAHAAGTGNINVLGWGNYQVPALDTPGITTKWTELILTSELYTKTAQPGTFDIVNPSVMNVGTMVELNRVQPIDRSRVPNLANTIESFSGAKGLLGPDGNLYALPFQYYFSYSVWNNKQTTQPRTFEDLMRPELKGKLGLLDDSFTLVVIGMLAGFNTGNFTEQQLEQIKGMLERLKPQVGSVYPFGGSVNLLARGEITMTIHSLADEIKLVREAGVDAGWAYFGSYGGLDTLALAKGAPNADAAYTYLDHMLSAPAQVGLSNTVFEVPVVKGVQDQITTDIKSLGTLDEMLQRAPVLSSIPAKGSNGMVGFAEWAEVWDAYRASF